MSSSPQPDLNRNRLPTLFERSVDYLDFWLDVAQHMSLCRHYVRELRRSVMIGTPKGEDAQSKRSSAALENLGEMNQPAAGPSMFNTEKKKNQDAQMSAFLREQSDTGEVLAPHGHSPSHSLGSNVSGNNLGADSNERIRPSIVSSPMELTSDSNSPPHTVARGDIRASAEKILYTFLLPGAEREIILPHAITQDITISIEERDVTIQKLIVGLLSMFAGFWAGFILIFLNYPHHTRVWLILPFTLVPMHCVLISMLLIPFLLWPAIANIHSCPFPRSENPLFEGFSINVPL
ncbi:hypothetical protein DID88_000536 [Monilinia fructigena]|uniref:RGS domain-containing protein n=1 Tax=Monilinia fructigena TaxID=38457 RepID=A0A395INE7_9HELO|nr:hypothetical protein DID88_000536 [Monilinia fructigena]